MITASTILLGLFFLDLYLNKSESILKRAIGLDRSLFIDIVYLILTYSGLFAVLAFYVGFGLQPYFEGLADKYIDASYNGWFREHPLIFIFFYLLMLDFLSYWIHRLFHSNDFLWQFHKVHHSATSMNIITAYRRHPIETTLKDFVFIIPLLLIGTPVEYVVYMKAFTQLVSMWSHTKLDWSLGWLEKYIVSPNFHYAHHATDPKLYNGNYAARFSFLDRMFGTFKGSKGVNFEIGVTDGNNHNSFNFFNSLFSPVFNNIRKIK